MTTSGTSAHPDGGTQSESQIPPRRKKKKKVEIVEFYWRGTMTSAHVLNLVIFTTAASEVLARVLNACWRGAHEKPSVTHMKPWDQELTAHACRLTRAFVPQ